jgi:hypothetical protein
MTRALVEIAMRGLVRFRSRDARPLFFRRLEALQRLYHPADPDDAVLTKQERHRRASQYFRQHGDHIDA